MKDNYMYKHRKVKKGKIMYVYKKNLCNKSSLTKEKECCKFDKTWTASLLKGLRAWLFDHSCNDTINQVFKIIFLRKC